MWFKFGLYEISIWLALSAIIINITSELINPYNGRTQLYIKYNRLKIIMGFLDLFFLITILINVYQIITL